MCQKSWYTKKQPRKEDSRKTKVKNIAEKAKTKGKDTKTKEIAEKLTR